MDWRPKQYPTCCASELYSTDLKREWFRYEAYDMNLLCFRMPQAGWIPSLSLVECFSHQAVLLPPNTSIIRTQTKVQPISANIQRQRFMWGSVSNLATVTRLRQKTCEKCIQNASEMLIVTPRLQHRTSCAGKPGSRCSPWRCHP